jgi:hypothetical protein
MIHASDALSKGCHAVLCFFAGSLMFYIFRAQTSAYSFTQVSCSSASSLEHGASQTCGANIPNVQANVCWC